MFPPADRALRPDCFMGSPLRLCQLWCRIVYTLQRRLLPMWLVSNILWPAAHALNFRYVAPEQRVLFVNVVSILWNAVSCQMVGSEGTVHHNVMYGMQRLAEFHTKRKPEQEIL